MGSRPSFSLHFFMVVIAKRPHTCSADHNTPFVGRHWPPGYLPTNLVDHCGSITGTCSEKARFLVLQLSFAYAYRLLYIHRSCASSVKLNGAASHSYMHVSVGLQRTSPHPCMPEGSAEHSDFSVLRAPQLPVSPSYALPLLIPPLPLTHSARGPLALACRPVPPCPAGSRAGPGHAPCGTSARATPAPGSTPCSCRCTRTSTPARQCKEEAGPRRVIQMLLTEGCRLVAPVVGSRGYVRGHARTCLAKRDSWKPHSKILPHTGWNLRW